MSRYEWTWSWPWNVGSSATGDRLQPPPQTSGASSYKINSPLAKGTSILDSALFITLPLFRATPLFESNKTYYWRITPKFLEHSLLISSFPGHNSCLSLSGIFRWKQGSSPASFQQEIEHSTSYTKEIHGAIPQRLRFNQTNLQKKHIILLYKHVRKNWLCTQSMNIQYNNWRRIIDTIICDQW